MDRSRFGIESVDRRSDDNVCETDSDAEGNWRDERDTGNASPELIFAVFAGPRIPSSCVA